MQLRLPCVTIGLVFNSISNAKSELITRRWGNEIILILGI